VFLLSLLVLFIHVRERLRETRKRLPRIIIASRVLFSDGYVHENKPTIIKPCFDRFKAVVDNRQLWLIFVPTRCVYSTFHDSSLPS